MQTEAMLPVMNPETNLQVTTKIGLVVEYDGTRYHGFQLQEDLPTIQRELETAIRELTGESIRLITASRTDAGVHARGQVISFRTSSPHSLETFVSALNYHLPNAISVKSAHRLADSFNVRRHAVSREYKYYILNSGTRSPLRDRFCYQVNGHLDVGAMDEAVQSLVGEHNFASFVSNDGVAAKGTVRKVFRAEVKREGDLIVFNIIANAFLMHQVRNTVGLLLRVGRGKLSINEFKDILDARTPGLAWPTAPARGLCLLQVNYANPLGLPQAGPTGRLSRDN